MIGFLISLFIVGIIAGYLGRLLVMGPDPMSFWETVLLGIAGSFVGGTLGVLIFAQRFVITPAGIVFAVPGAVVALLIYRKIKFGTISPRR